MSEIELRAPTNDDWPDILALADAFVRAPDLGYDRAILSLRRCVLMSAANKQLAPEFRETRLPSPSR